MEKNKQDITEELKVVGPGVLLSEARENQSLTIEHVASKLNFRTTLIKNIEADVYDRSLPDTYNRGYLKNYAKLMGLSLEEIINSYEQLNLLPENNPEMRSFSRGTVKKAENNLLMWISYVIFAIFIGFTMMWWLQEEKIVEVPSHIIPTEDTAVISNIPSVVAIENTVNQEVDKEKNKAITHADEEPVKNKPEVTSSIKTNSKTNTLIESNIEKQIVGEAVFTFSGDCWVNIHDVTGKRIAWGIKKAGYIMPIKGKTPFNITIGKPELVKITFNGADVDMSSFSEGHISKFTLPLTPNSTKKR